MKRNPLPCATKLRLLLDYDPRSGDLRWKLSARRGYKPGDIAGSIHKARNSYRIVRIEGRGYYAHLLIWKIVTGEEPVGLIDHADTNGLNNKWVNLRPASNAENGFNRRVNKNNKSGVKGVHWDADHGAWKAAITANKTVHVLGFFPDVASASATIENARPKYHGEFARAS
jgi:hypothetical protein